MKLLVRGAGSPELPLRLLNLLAQQGVTVTKATIDLIDGDYRVEVDVIAERKALLAEKVRSMVLVDSVELGSSC